MERDEGWEAGILSMYLKIQSQMSKSKILKSCISEGFLPNGVRGLGTVLTHSEEVQGSAKTAQVWVQDRESTKTATKNHIGNTHHYLWAAWDLQSLWQRLQHVQETALSPRGQPCRASAHLWDLWQRFQGQAGAGSSYCYQPLGSSQVI